MGRSSDHFSSSGPRTPRINSPARGASVRSINNPAPRDTGRIKRMAMSDEQELVKYARTHGHLVYDPELADLDYSQVRSNYPTAEFHVGIRNGKVGKILVLLTGKQDPKGPFKIFVLSKYNYKGFSNNHPRYALRPTEESD